MNKNLESRMGSDFLIVGEGRSSRAVRLLAFTLAETLIAIVIIGVVAILTVRVLSDKYNAYVTYNRLMSFQSAFTQAVFKAEAENGVMESWLSKPSDKTKTAKEIGEKIVPYLALLENCGTSDPKGKCVYKGRYKKKNNANGYIYSTDSHHYKVRLQNGSSVWWTYTSNKDLQVYIDINGPKPPNKHANDLFLFYLKDRIFAPMGGPTSSWPYKTHCATKNSDGWGCTWYVMTYRKMDYPR